MESIMKSHEVFINSHAELFARMRHIKWFSENGKTVAKLRDADTGMWRKATQKELYSYLL